MPTTANKKIGTTGNDKLTASPGDVVNGGAGNDVITGAVGATMRGGTGSDTLIFSAEGQKQSIKLTLTEQLKGDVTPLSKTIISGFEHFDVQLSDAGDTLDARNMGFLVGSMIEYDKFSGGAGSDTLILNGKASGNLYASDFETLIADFSDQKSAIYFDGSVLKFNKFYGLFWLSGNTFITGGSGNDEIEIIGQEGTAKIYGGAGNDQIGFSHNGYSNLLTGALYDGGTGNDIVTGHAGATMRGGAGIDHLNLSLYDMKTAVYFRPSEQLSSEIALFENTKLTGFEHFRMNFGMGNDTLDLRGMNFGTKYNIGNAIYDEFSSFSGGLGTDTVVLDSSFSGNVAASGFERIKADFSDINTSIVVESGRIDFNGFSFGGGFNSIDIVGGAGEDYFYGGDGKDKLNGGAGRDFLRGGAGDDLYIIDSTDEVYEVSWDGVDTIQISTSYRLLRNFENLTLTGRASINGIGNELANVIKGNSGNNILDGLEGLDTLIGGAGNDTYWIDALADVVIDSAGIDKILATASCSLENYKDIENLTLTGTRNINGTGNTLANSILGNSGNNILDGGKGADILEGGAGNDSYVLGADYDTVIDISGRDTITSTISRSLAAYQTIENLKLEGNENLNATGNDLDNSILGNDGNNVLNGGHGHDTLTGGNGNDTYVIGADSDIVLDDAGIDTITSTIGRDLNDYWKIENLKLLGSADINGYGSDLNNSIWGNSANNHLKGANGADRLFGSQGMDILEGGSGNDMLVGGADADIFRFNTKLGSTNIDVIDDFNTLEDMIQLKSKYFAEAGKVGALATSAFWAGTKAHDASDRIIYDKTTGKLFYDADGTGSGAAIQFATLDKNLTLKAADFDIIA